MSKMTYEQSLIEAIADRDKRIAELEKILQLVKKDLLMRADKDSEGCKVVEMSSSIWLKLSEALKCNSWPDETRIDNIGQNGNDGDHY